MTQPVDNNDTLFPSTVPDNSKLTTKNILHVDPVTGDAPSLQVCQQDPQDLKYPQNVDYVIPESLLDFYW